MSTTPSASTTAPLLLAGLRHCVARYDGFLIDLWGVLHDGAAPFDGAVDALRQLRTAGKKVVLLSNSSDNTPQAIKRLRGIGFGTELYDVLITSGALVGVALRDDSTLWLPGKHNKIFMIGASALAMQYNAQDLDLVTEPEDAGLILNGWYAATVEESVEWRDDMRRWIALGLPMVCMNPDLEVIHLGAREACPGTFAAEYGRLGGRVHYYGKPYAPAYHAAVAAMGLPPTAKLAMIGDNMLTDIKGGTDFGIDTILIAGGVHRESLGQEWGALPPPERVAALCAAYGMSPTLVLGRMGF
jgi:HAD superfamily hydrolase (TIGR01459 family)